MARILVVEDNDDFREVLIHALQEAGHSIVEAENGRVALDKLRTEKVDLILTDIVMPETDGLEMIMSLRESTNKAPILVITGGHSNAELYLKVAQSLGASRVLPKPFQIAELLAKVEEVLSESPGDR